MNTPVKTLAAAEIDAVVREVLRRLLASGGESSPVGKHAPAAQAAVNAAAVSSGNNSATKSLTVPERLVTLATVRDWLTGIERVVVRPDAVVTPAVADELRERGIRLTRGQGSLQTSPVAGQLLLAAAETELCPRAAARQLGSMVRVVTNRDNRPLPELLPTLLAEMKQHSARAVLLTDHPEAALCLANGTPNLCAVEGRNSLRLAKVLDRLSPNLLLLDGAERSPYEIRKLIQQYQATRCAVSPKPRQV